MELCAHKPSMLCELERLHSFPYVANEIHAVGGQGENIGGVTSYLYGYGVVGDQT
jgi:hypothetical protein